MSDSTHWEEDWQEELRDWKARGLRRELKPPHGIDFTSNDYLGLGRSPEVQAAAARAITQWGCGAGSARLLRGELAVHQEAEQVAATWQGADSALLFPSGYQANLALLSTLAGRDDVLFSDALNHASLIDGSRLSRAQVEIFPHLDLGVLEAQLQQHASARRRWVVVERIYSMDGDCAPIAELLRLCEQYDAALIVDEAHAAGLMPPLADHPHLAARIVTGGKALGVAGAFVLGRASLRELLIHRGRSFVFTTATPPPIAAALTAAIQALPQQASRVQQLMEKAQLLRCLLQAEGVDARGETAIVPVVIGNAERSLSIAQAVQAAGFDVRAVRPPTVPDGQSRLRLVVRADHSEAQIRAVAKAIAQACQGESVEVKLPSQPSKGWVVAGTDTGIGKTIVSALLLRALRNRGVASRYLKPIQTGDDCDTSTVLQLNEALEESTASPLFHYALPASPDQAAEAEGNAIDPTAVLARSHQVMGAEPESIWLVEGAGGVRVPWTDHFDQLDAFASLRLPVLLVARTELGTLNHTLLSVDALQARGLALQAVILVGAKHNANERSLRARLGKTPLLHLPFADDRLDAAQLDQWIADGILDTLPLPHERTPSLA